MSKLYSANSVGYKLQFPGPETVEEFDAKGGAGSALEEAVASTIYRGTLPEFHEKFTPVLEKITGVTRGIDVEATEKRKAASKNPANVEDVLEKFKAFNARARAAYFSDENGAPLADEVIAEREKELADAAAEVALTIEVDPSPSARAGLVNKGWLAKADDILSRDDDGIEAVVTKLLNGVGEFDLARDEEGKPERSSLARLVGKFIEASI